MTPVWACHHPGRESFRGKRNPLTGTSGVWHVVLAPSWSIGRGEFGLRGEVLEHRPGRIGSQVN
jgi:hypothetical protein